jgi:hypothetical protein
MSHVNFFLETKLKEIQKSEFDKCVHISKLMRSAIFLEIITLRFSYFKNSYDNHRIIFENIIGNKSLTEIENDVNNFLINCSKNDNYTTFAEEYNVSEKNVAKFVNNIDLMIFSKFPFLCNKNENTREKMEIIKKKLQIVDEPFISSVEDSNLTKEQKDNFDNYENYFKSNDNYDHKKVNDFLAYIGAVQRNNSSESLQLFKKQIINHQKKIVFNNIEKNKEGGGEKKRMKKKCKKNTKKFFGRKEIKNESKSFADSNYGSENEDENEDEQISYIDILTFLCRNSGEKYYDFFDCMWTDIDDDANLSIGMKQLHMMTELNNMYVNHSVEKIEKKMKNAQVHKIIIIDGENYSFSNDKNDYVEFVKNMKNSMTNIKRDDNKFFDLISQLKTTLFFVHKNKSKSEIIGNYVDELNKNILEEYEKYFEKIGELYKKIVHHSVCVGECYIEYKNKNNVTVNEQFNKMYKMINDTTIFISKKFKEHEHKDLHNLMENSYKKFFANSVTHGSQNSPQNDIVKKYEKYYHFLKGFDDYMCCIIAKMCEEMCENSIVHIFSKDKNVKNRNSDEYVHIARCNFSFLIEFFYSCNFFINNASELENNQLMHMKDKLMNTMHNDYLPLGDHILRMKFLNTNGDKIYDIHNNKNIFNINKLVNDTKNIDQIIKLKYFYSIMLENGYIKSYKKVSIFPRIINLHDFLGNGKILSYIYENFFTTSDSFFGTIGMKNEYVFYTSFLTILFIFNNLLMDMNIFIKNNIGESNLNKLTQEHLEEQMGSIFEYLIIFRENVQTLIKGIKSFSSEDKIESELWKNGEQVLSKELRSRIMLFEKGKNMDNVSEILFYKTYFKTYYVHVFGCLNLLYNHEKINNSFLRSLIEYYVKNYSPNKQPSQTGGNEYKRKYLKYKQKYLSLKNRKIQ